MKFTLLILILFTKSCSSQEAKNKQEQNKINNEVIIEFEKPIEGFEIKIFWNIKDSIPDTNSVIGPAKIVLNRKIDNRKFEIIEKEYVLTDSVFREKIFNAYKNKSIPNILQLLNCDDLIFKDINFDNKNEIIIMSEYFDEEIQKAYSNHRIFEFINDELIEIDYFPIQALDWSGEINYEKQEVITREYFNCCSYEASFFKYDKNSKEKLVFYKSENHNVDATNGDDEIIVEEKGKKKITIFKKGK
jgi:hypothetical protein